MNKKKVNVLHLASFIGNIGDNANHSGLKNNIKNYLDFDFSFTSLEIREFYWKERKFDDSFAEICNEYDLVIIGGGNYFELWVDNSSTGTSLDISIDLLQKINTPIFFCSLGVDAGQGASEIAINKFKTFIDFIIQNKHKYFLSVRNDGSYTTVKNLLGVEYLKNFTQIPDGGFSLNLDQRKSYKFLNQSVKYIGINIAGDMTENRFGEKTEEILDELALTLEEIGIKYPNYNFIFFPHILKDCIIYNKILSKLKDSFVRRRCIIAPLIHGDHGMKIVFSMYSECELILGNRFHSNVCSIALGVPVIGLYNYIQIKNLYLELNIQDFLINISKTNFKDDLIHKIDYIINEKTVIKNMFNNVRENLQIQNNIGFEHLNHWLNKLNF